jgi:hypothetical protein
MLEITGLLGAPCGRTPSLQQIRARILSDWTVDAERAHQAGDTSFRNGRKEAFDIPVHHELAPEMLNAPLIF